MTTDGMELVFLVLEHMCNVKRIHKETAVAMWEDMSEFVGNCR